MYVSDGPNREFVRRYQVEALWSPFAQLAEFLLQVYVFLTYIYSQSDNPAFFPFCHSKSFAEIETCLACKQKSLLFGEKFSLEVH